jgi:hypothetical protein
MFKHIDKMPAIETDEDDLSIFYVTLTGDYGKVGVFSLNIQNTGNDHCMFHLWFYCFGCWGSPFLCQH